MKTRKRKHILIGSLLALAGVLLLFSCGTNPMTGRRTMALISNDQLFPMSFAQFEEVMATKTVVTGTPEAQMVQRVGENIVRATERWLDSKGRLSELDGYEWEFVLVQDDSINAWVMPGGKIVFYTGILPFTANEAGLAVVMGHEVAHAVLNHGQQRMSAAMLQQLGFITLAGLTAGQSQMTQGLLLTSFGVGSNLFGTLPFSRQHELEADHLGTILMAIAGYNPEESVLFWERLMAIGGGAPPAFLSTHPSDAARIDNLRRVIPEAKSEARRFGVNF